MILNILNYTNNKNKINKKYICKKHDGEDICPEIEWKIKNNNNIKSYSLIFEDITVGYIHLYIPYIHKNIRKIESFSNLSFEDILKNNSKLTIIPNKILEEVKMYIGKNTIGENKYHGPCAPDGTGIHTYIFRLYALDGIMNINSIKSSSEFKAILKKNKINIIDYAEKEFHYSYKN